MSGLKRQIKQLEQEIAIDKIVLSQNKEQLAERIATPKFLSLAMLGGFALGFLIEHDQMRGKVTGALDKAPAILKGFNTIMSILSI